MGELGHQPLASKLRYSGFREQEFVASVIPSRQHEDDRRTRRINLDANANASPSTVVIEAILAALHDVGNPSSAHAAGQDARITLENARDAVASLCDGMLPEDVIFTSGCTEANNVIVASARMTNATLITSSVEHASIARAAEALAASGGKVVMLPVAGSGLVDLRALREALRSAEGPVFLSVQTANSETGVIQPIETIAALAAEHPNVLFHSDAAQGFGKRILPVGQHRGPHVISVSGHKMHAPMGVGALLLREGEDRIRPLMLGGDQERGLRAGTQPLALIAGFAAACTERYLKLEEHVTRMRSLRDRLEAGIRTAIPSVTVNGGEAPRLPNTSNIRFPGKDAMALIAQLDAEGVLASQGSACHSQRPEPSPVLIAMGLSEEEAFASVRFSVSPLNTEDEIDSAVEVIVSACDKLALRS